MTVDVAIIFGTRPSYIKLWPVYKALCAEGLEPTVVCTGQHQELIRPHMDVLDMPVHHWLDVMRDATDLNSTVSLVLTRVSRLLAVLKPTLVIVHGDTTSGLGAALATYHLGIPVAHIEAGLRSGNPQSPFPEETNRIAMDALSTLLYSPTSRATDEARKTNPVAKIQQVGNPVVDSVQAIRSVIDSWARPLRQPYLLLDLHRRESFGPPMKAMVSAVVAAAELYAYEVLWPAHPNPQVQAVAQMLDVYRALTRCEPMRYDEFLHAIRYAALVVTDSGGTVEEAPSLGTPTLQLRDDTDRCEAIAAQCSWLVGREPAHVEKLVSEALVMADAWKASIARRPNPFGDGRTGPRIAKSIKEWLAAR